MLALVEPSLDASAPFSLLVSIVLLGGGLALLLAGAHHLVESATSAAVRLGVSQLTIGLTVIAFGTSAPELALNVVAASSSDSGAKLAFGNVVGSNIANIGLVLSIACLVCPVVAHRSVRRVYLPLLLLTEGVLIVLVATADAITRLDGILLLCGLPVAVLVLHRLASGSDGTDDPIPQPAGASPLVLGGLVVLGLAMMLAGAKLSEMGAVSMARHAGLSEAAIGLTVVAIATSLPESFTALIAARRGHSDLAIGTVVGSNLFNILSVLAITSIVQPVPIPEDLGWGSLIAMLAFSLALVVIYVERPRPAGWRAPMLGRHTLSKTWGGIVLACWVGVMLWCLTAGQ